ncbi:hypothetical protein BH10CYA1_BH10CYA1_38000 [soil metagenome]
MQSRNFCSSLKTALQAASLVVLAVIAMNPADAASKNYRLPTTTMTHMAYAPSLGSRNGLPATCMDSFVANAVKAGRGDEIYGDEGIGASPPPFYEGFTANHRINAGIVGQQDAGLTTGHGSYLPDAWGRDEYLGQEWSQGGQNNNGYSKISTPDIQVVASYDIPPVAPSFKNQRFNNSAATNGGGSGGTFGAGNASSQGSRGYSTYGSGSANQADSGF